jgi:hypothetical protein
MNTKIIRQYGTEILQYRLRTARQKKRMQYEDLDKKLLSLYKEEHALYKQKRNIEWVPLKPPVQRGWVRYFVLRDDVARSRQASFFENILEKINTISFSHRKDFKVKKRLRGRKIHIVKAQYLKKLESYEFQKLNFTDAEKRFFYEVWELNSCKQLVKRFVFADPWRFVLRIRPDMISKVLVIDIECEQRLKEIDNYLERTQLRKRQLKVLYGYDKRKWRDYTIREKEKNRLLNMPLSRILDKVEDGEL